MKEVVYVSWYWHDRWDSNEEGGCSLHKSSGDFEQWKAAYEKKVERNGEMPDAYFIARKDIKKALVSDELYNSVVNSEFGLRFSEEEEPLMIASGKLKIL